MKYANIALAVLFLLFTVVQFNDETGAIGWILSYLAFSVLFALAFTGRLYRLPTALAVLGCLAALIIFSPGLMDFLTNDDGIGFGQTMSNEYPYIEEMREWGGLLISLIALVFLYWQVEKERKKTASESEAVA